jgi:hypothetical protein
MSDSKNTCTALEMDVVNYQKNPMSSDVFREIEMKHDQSEEPDYAGYAKKILALHRLLSPN